ncbi:Uncharacterised protein [Mycoplasmopsis columboralis]|uniref:Uncharacterized protein n=2 Tax=Mycoplasmopsis columboralis TaxID=171282 RepID=A0A449B631_9BACT|nr:Uncharacterised protein [Mycoplasmopsis columboralis]
MDTIKKIHKTLEEPTNTLLGDNSTYINYSFTIKEWHSGIENKIQEDIKEKLNIDVTVDQETTNTYYFSYKINNPEQSNRILKYLSDQSNIANIFVK